MKHDNQTPSPAPLDPELEARVVAWIAGELPPAEVTELEQLVAASPALARFKRRMEAVQDLITEAERADSAPLRLSLERRAKLLRALGAAEASEAPSHDNVVALPAMPSRWSWRRPQLYFSTAGMAAACLAVLFVWEKQQTPRYEATAEIHFKKKETVLSQQAVADTAVRHDGGGLELDLPAMEEAKRKAEAAFAANQQRPEPVQAVDAFYSSISGAGSGRLNIPGLEEAQKKAEAEMKGLLSASVPKRQDVNTAPEQYASTPPKVEAPIASTGDQSAQMQALRGMTVISSATYSSAAPSPAPKAATREASAETKETRLRALAETGTTRGATATDEVKLLAKGAPGAAPSSPVAVNLDGIPTMGGGLNVAVSGANVRLNDSKQKNTTLPSVESGRASGSSPAGIIPSNAIQDGKLYGNLFAPAKGIDVSAGKATPSSGYTYATGSGTLPAAEGLARAQRPAPHAPTSTGITSFPAEKTAEAPITLEAFSIDPRSTGAKAKTTNRSRDFVKTDSPGAGAGQYTFINGDFTDEPRKDADAQTVAGALAGMAPFGASGDVASVTSTTPASFPQIILQGGTTASRFPEPANFDQAPITIGGGGDAKTRNPSLSLGAISIPPLSLALLNEAGTAPEATTNTALEQDKPRAKSKAPAPAPTLEETATARDPVSTFSLHVSDVSFRLAQAALARGELPDASRIRAEEFYNAFDYGDPKPAVTDKVGARIEQGGHPFLPQRNLVRVALRVPANGRSTGTPLRLTVLLDTSGSMEREDRAAAVRRALEVLVSLLGPEDRLTLIGFAREPHLLVENLPGDRARSALDLLARTPAEGGTNLEAALKLGGELAQRYRTPGAQNRLVLLTDGAANLGNADPAQLGRAVEALRQQGLAFDACGVGLDGLDDEVLESLTRRGDGRYYALNSPADAEAGFAQKLAGAFRPAAENVKVQVRFNPARVGHYRLIGFEQHRLSEEDFRNDKVDAAELAAEEAAVALYQVELLPAGEGELGELFVRFRDPSTSRMVERQWTLPYDPAAPAFDRASPSLQLAGSAAFLAEKLRGGPAAATISLRELAPVAATLRGRYPQDARVQDFFTMIGQARRLLGDSP